MKELFLTNRRRIKRWQLLAGYWDQVWLNALAAVIAWGLLYVPLKTSVLTWLLFWCGQLLLAEIFCGLRAFYFLKKRNPADL